MNYFKKRKEEIRREAIEFQSELSGKSLSFSELADQKAYFENLARRYGLLTEFRENGIL